MLYYLIYLSSAKNLFTEAELSDILTKSRLNNTSKDVTGLLLYHEGSILQVLEGNEETVTALYNKIEQDRRHSNIMKMVSGTSEQRHFPDWSMGFKSVTADEWQNISGYLTLDPANILSRLKQQNGKINAMVNSFAAVNRI